MIKCRSIKTILSVIALSALFFSCKNQLSQTSDNIDNKKNDSILYELKGKIHFDYSDYKSSENLITPSSRAAIAIPETLSCTVTASEAEVSSTTPAVWSVKTGGRTFTASTDSANNFIIKLPAGNWLLSAASEYFSTPTDCVAQVEINPATNTLAYVTNIEIIVKSKITVANGGNSGGHGTVNLTLSDDTGTIKTVRASRVVSGTIDVIQIMSETSANSKTFVFTWGEPTGSPAQNPEVASGVYDVTFDFYTEEASTIESVPETLPVYSFNDYINVFDNAETNTWLLDSNSSVYGGLAAGATAGSEGELVPSVFKITRTALDNYKKYVYFVSTVAQVEAAYQNIVTINDANTETNLQNRPEFQLILTDNISYSSSSVTTSLISNIEDPLTATSFSCYRAINLNPTKPLKLTVCGKNSVSDYSGTDKLYTMDFSTLNSASTAACGIFANKNTRLTLSNIEIKGAKIGVWRDCEEVSSSWTASFITLKNRVIIKDNEQNLKFTETNPTATQAQSDTSIPEAPIIIDSTFSPQSRIGLMFGDKDADVTKETPCAVTTGFSDRFSSSSGIVPKDIFFSDRGYNIILEDDEVSWNNVGGQGNIYAEVLKDVDFTATGNMQNETACGGAKYDTDNNRFLIGYKDSSAYIYVIPTILNEESSNEESLLIQTGYNTADFTLHLEYENGGLVPIGSDDDDPAWNTAPYTETLTGSTTPVQTGRKFFVSDSDNTIPTGRYKLVATAYYNGKKYTKYWDLSYVKVLFTIDRTLLPVNSSSEDVKPNVLFDEGYIKNVTDENDVLFTCSCNKITGLSNDGSFETSTSETAYYAEGQKKITFSSSNLSSPSIYLLNVSDINYKGIKCYNEGETVTSLKTLISVDNKKSFYFTPDISLHTPLNDDDLQSLITKAQSEPEADYNIYLMGDAVATDDTMQETDQETDEELSFIKINGSTNPAPISLRITSYGSTIYSINAAGTPYAAGSSENVLSSDKTGRVLYIGRNASVTFEKVQIKGGYAHKGTALLVSKGSSVNLINTYVGDTSTNIIGYCAATNSFENISNPDNGNPGSLIYIDSSNTEGESSTFICKDTIFNRNMGMIYIGSGTNLSISGTISSTDSNVSSTMFFSNSLSGNANFIDIDGNLQPGSSIKGVVFYKNWFINASDSAQADKPISIIKTSSNNLLLQNIKMYNNASSFSTAHFYSSGVFCTSNNSTGSVDLKDCHFYSNNQPINSSTDSASDFVAVCLRGGTVNITDCTFTELSEDNNYAIYTGVSGTNSPASPLTNRINLSGTVYTDGEIYLCKPYISSGGSVIGNRMFVDSTLTLPDADYLTAISGNTYATDPATFGTIILHYDSVYPASAYKEYSQVLEGTIKDVRAYRSKFTVKLDDTDGTEKSLDERGQLEW